MKRTITPDELATKDLHQYIIGAIAPRPIAFVSTKDAEGNDNLAPYSFFNAFSSNPPILVFSSNRKVSDNTTKDTLQNVKETGEAVINVVNYDIVRQMSLASVEFPKGISEFAKVGLTPEDSDIVKAKRVKESPVNLECRVKEIITLGDKGGAGHLIVCEVVKIHISESVLTGDRIDPHKLDLMGRMGRSYYVRASGNAVMDIYQNVVDNILGFDALPDYIRKSTILTGNEIAIMAACHKIPIARNTVYGNMSKEDMYHEVKALLNDEKGEEALQILIDFNSKGII